MDLISTISAGGKRPRPSAPGLVLQTKEPFLKKALAPFAYYLAGHVQTGSNFVIVVTLRRQ
jgi:hypothetical protein